MKKLLTLVIAGGMLAFYACGPSAAEIEAAKKKTQDSIQAVNDSVAKIEAAAAAEQLRLDSIAKADAEAIAKAKQDSIDAAAANAKPGKKKTIEQKKVEEAKKATSGRG